LTQMEASIKIPWMSLEGTLVGKGLARFALSSLKRREQMKRLKGPKERQRFAERKMRLLVRRGLEIAGGAQGRLWLLTGGHCAESFFDILGLKGARIRRLLMPGLPLLEADGAEGLKVWASSKPGGFGSDDLMLRFMNL
jgi:uncharacterized protein YgbK (DUF1537 family)